MYIILQFHNVYNVHSYFLATNNNRPASSMPVALAATMVLPELKGKK